MSKLENSNDRAFGFNGREGLALMGVHAVGKLNSVFSGNAYR